MKYSTLQECIDNFKDTPEGHTDFANTFTENMLGEIDLSAHRKFVEDNEWGFGERSFHWMWNLIIQELPERFKFLEIGVYKGQVISLMSMLNLRYKKEGIIFAITPLDSSAGKVDYTHPNINYEEAIARIYAQFNLSAEDLQIIQGLSTDSKIIGTAIRLAPFHVIYVDGAHDYDSVVSDLNIYKELVQRNGYLVIDDACCDMKIPDGLIRLNWRGIPEVTKAKNEVIDTDIRFRLLFTVSHNAVYQRIA